MSASTTTWAAASPPTGPAWRPCCEQFRARGLLFLEFAHHGADASATRWRRSWACRASTRNVFLDDDEALDAVRRKLAETEAVARRQGFAVAIGHPHEATLQALAEWLPGVAAKGFALAPAVGGVAQAQRLGLMVISSLREARGGARRNRADGGVMSASDLVAHEPLRRAYDARHLPALRAGRKTRIGGIARALSQAVHDRGAATRADRGRRRHPARGRQRGGCGHRLRAGAGRGRSADVRHRRLRLVRHLHAGQEVPRLHRRPRAGAARRAARHVGQPDRERGARRLRLHPEGPRQRHRLQVDLRAGQPQDVLRGAQGARQRCRGRASSSRRSTGPRAAGRCGRTSISGGPTAARSAARRTTSAPASRRRRARSTAGPTARRSRSATASSTATTARPLRAIAKGGADVFYSGEIAQAIAEDMRSNDALLSIEDLKALEDRAQSAAVGRLSRLPRLDQPAAGRRRDADRDAEHPREFRPRARSSTTRPSICASSPRR